MRIGCCLNMNAKDPYGIGVYDVEKATAAGCDYVELPLAQMMSLENQEFGELKRRVRDAGIRCEACNNFVPADVRLTGPSVDKQRVHDYLERALERAAELGVSVIVFGSAGAKNVPEGFSADKAWEQVKDFLFMTDGLLGKSRITVVIEPICCLEGNLIRTVPEAVKMAKEVSLPHIRVLADYYHMVNEKEPVEASVASADSWIFHTHAAIPEGRAFPEKGTACGLQPFFKALKKIDYKQRVSLEAYAQSFGSQIQEAVDIMRSLQDN